MKVVAFDIWGDYGHFRRFFTTSSPLTYSFPPPTAVRGIVGAILGLDKNAYLQVTANLAIGVRVLAPVKRVRWGTNLINTKSRSGGKFDPTLIWSRKENKRPRTPIKAEYLKAPYFRLYIGGEGAPLEDLEALLREHRTHYTVSLGLSELLADFEYEGTHVAHPIPPGAYEVITVFPVDVLEDLSGSLREGVKFAKERVPVYLDFDRTPLLYQDVVLEVHGQAIQMRVKEMHQLDTGEVVYLWPPASIHIPASR